MLFLVINKFSSFLKQKILIILLKSLCCISVGKFTYKYRKITKKTPYFYFHCCKSGVWGGLDNRDYRDPPPIPISDLADIRMGWHMGEFSKIPNVCKIWAIYFSKIIVCLKITLRKIPFLQNMGEIPKITVLLNMRDLFFEKSNFYKILVVFQKSPLLQIVGELLKIPNICKIWANYFSKIPFLQIWTIYFREIQNFENNLIWTENGLSE